MFYEFCVFVTPTFFFEPFGFVIGFTFYVFVAAVVAVAQVVLQLI